MSPGHYPGPVGGNVNKSPRPCLECGVVFTPRIRRPTFFCSRSCKDARRQRLQRDERLAAKAAESRACVVCGGLISAEFRGDRAYCGDRCARLARRHTGNSTRRLRVPDQGDPISRVAVYERDAWICQLCSEPVDPNLEYPDPRAASLDHVVPLSRGGTHESTNLQLAHLKCNVSARDVKESLNPRPPVLIEGKPYFRVPEAAEMIGVTRNVLDAAIRAGRVPALQPSRYRYLSAQTVAELQVAGLPDGRQHRSQAAAEAAERRRVERRRTCATCGAEFDFPNPDNRRRFCSSDCYRAERNRRRRLSDDEKGRPVESWQQACATCGTLMTVTKDRPRRFSCSPKCARARKAAREKERKPVAPRDCAVCGKPVPARTRPGRMSATCSDPCREEWPKLRARRWHAANKRRQSQA